MNPLLTTITPYWGRPEMLERWWAAIKGASIPEVAHIVYFIGRDSQPPWAWDEEPGQIIPVPCSEGPGASIGHYHNRGAKFAESEWIMKMDVDALPHERFFKELIPVLQTAGERQWFNCGMFYMSESASHNFLSKGMMPIKEDTYCTIMGKRQFYTNSSYVDPAATNFICRRKDYLDLGGCDTRFHGWGWEDYQQIYMLEHHQRRVNPLPGLLNFANVTQRCRDEISRPKALELWRMNFWLCLLHHWHATPRDGFKNPGQSFKNRQVLWEYIVSHNQLCKQKI